MKYKDLVEQIIRDMERTGRAPWDCGWNNSGGSGFPMNIKGNRYRGFNFFVAMRFCEKHNCRKRIFLTLRQANELGAILKDDAIPMNVTFWGKIMVEKDDTEKFLSFIRVYQVFNVQYFEGLKLDEPQEPDHHWTPLEKCDNIVVNYKNRPKIKESTDGRAFYRRTTDEIYLPPLKDFHNVETFYSTAFHELTHSTGHESRLNRDTLMKSAGFGSDPYSKEELIAEMGAAFLCAESGIYNRMEQERSADYIKSWCSRFREKPALLWQSASKAQRAVDFILGTKFEGKEKQ